MTDQTSRFLAEKKKFKYTWNNLFKFLFFSGIITFSSVFLIIIAQVIYEGCSSLISIPFIKFYITFDAILISFLYSIIDFKNNGDPNAKWKIPC